MKHKTTNPKNRTTKSSTTAAPPQPPPSPPNWPALKPLVPTSSLTLSSLLDSQILIARNFWTSTLCRDYVSFLRTLPLVTTPGKPKKGDAVRVNDRFQIMDPLFAERLWVETGLRELVNGNGRGDGEDGEEMSKEDREKLWGGEVIGLNPSIRIYRYTPGQFFDQHYDESNLLNLPTTPSPTPAKTTWTLLLYLTSPATGCAGGQTVFYPDDDDLARRIVVELETGMLLLHRHGRECMLHEGREVTAGEKWVIRSDLCVRR